MSTSTKTATGGTIIIMGCGASGGVPLAGNKWIDCDPNEPRDRRMRASIAVKYNHGKNLIVDTGPDFRNQVNLYGIDRAEAVIYTHSHADHVSGIDDLRYYNIHEREVMPIYADERTINDIKQRFDYMFQTSEDKLYKPVVEPNIITNDMLYRPLKIADCPMMMVEQEHGSRTSIGFRFGNTGYSTDVSIFSNKSLKKLQGIDNWIVDCGQYASDFVYAHPSFEVVKKWNETVGAKRVILTHLTPRIPYQRLIEELPEGYEPAYDGLTVDFKL